MRFCLGLLFSCVTSPSVPCPLRLLHGQQGNHVVVRLPARWPGSVWVIPDSKAHGANMGPTWVLSAPDGPHVGSMNLAIRDCVDEGSYASSMGCAALAGVIIAYIILFTCIKAYVPIWFLICWWLYRHSNRFQISNCMLTSMDFSVEFTKEMECRFWDRALLVFTTVRLKQWEPILHSLFSENVTKDHFSLTVKMWSRRINVHLNCMLLQ